MMPEKKTGKVKKSSCGDRNCPFHGNLRVRGRGFLCKVLSAKSQKTAAVEMIRMYYIPKYERYAKRKTKLQVHVPGCLSVKAGDSVRVFECRPVSKTKNFAIVVVLKDEGSKS